jgi:hydrogenase/urease accessory protein HupE
MRAAFFVLACVMLLPSMARAHAIGLSSGDYRADAMSVKGSLTFARGEMASLVPALDENHDGHVTATEVYGHRTELEDKVLRRVSVRRHGAACASSILDAALTEQDGLVLVGRWTCTANEGPFEVELRWLDDVARGHRHLAHVTSGESARDEILFGTQRAFSMIPARAAQAQAQAQAQAKEESDPSSAGVPTTTTSVLSFFRMGIEHILTGYDHLVFVLGLVLVRARLRSLLWTVTAFTVAHSVTLALAVLGVWSPSSRFIEPAIALSIAYVGIENLIVRDADTRWRITFPFGLIHGFGFAGALQEIAIPRAKLFPALAAFNLGVEAGQLAVLALVLPLIVLLRKYAWFDALGVRITSCLVAGAGLVWFFARVGQG